MKPHALSGGFIDVAGNIWFREAGGWVAHAVRGLDGIDGLPGATGARGLTGFSTRERDIVKSLVSLNSPDQDVTVFRHADGLPSRYRIESVTGYAASADVSAARFTMYSGTWETGDVLIDNALAGLDSFDDTATYSLTEVASDNLTAPLIFVRNTVANGSPASFTIKVSLVDLS